MKTETAYFNYIDGIELPSYIVDNCPKSGACDNYIDDCLTYDEFIIKELSTINESSLKTELSEYGAWTDEELDNHYENLERILWIAIFNIYEERYNNEQS